MGGFPGEVRWSPILHGKAGVDGSSPSEGSKIPAKRGFLLSGLVHKSTSLTRRGSAGRWWLRRAEISLGILADVQRPAQAILSWGQVRGHFDPTCRHIRQRNNDYATPRLLLQRLQPTRLIVPQRAVLDPPALARLRQDPLDAVSLRRHRSPPLWLSRIAGTSDVVEQIEGGRTPLLLLTLRRALRERATGGGLRRFRGAAVAEYLRRRLRRLRCCLPCLRHVVSFAIASHPASAI